MLATLGSPRVLLSQEIGHDEPPGRPAVISWLGTF